MKKCSTCGSLYEGDLCPKCMAGFAQQRTTPATAPPAEELPLKPGQTFHGLEIVELLGRGGMGVVYKARQPGLDRLVALKILPQRLALDPDFQSRFAREAKALGALSHPNIVAVHDFGAEAGLFYFVMEFVDGVNLRELLRQGKVAPEQALKIVPQLCDALEFAHGEGVVHRDIKPENILLDKRGRVKIADFGLAKLTGADQPVNLTQTNMVMGTPHYMAPEQIENPKSVDHRADIYSMGVVLYEMLTGELPLGKFEPPSKRVQVDVRLDEVVLKSLEKQPERRYQKASEVKDDVTRATSIASAPRPAQATRSTYALAALALSAIVLFFLTRSSPSPAPIVVVPPPVKPEIIDLSKVYFSQEERPGDWRLSGAPKILERNPFPAKTPEDLDRLVKQLDNEGLANVTRADIKEGYYALWGFRGGCSLIALDTPIAERLERDFATIKNCAHRWSHRKGDFIVLVMAGPRENRAVFADLVARLQKKLGLPDSVPDLHHDNVIPDTSDLPTGWSYASNRSAAGRESPPRAYWNIFVRPDGKDALSIDVFRPDTVREAETLEESLRKSPTLTPCRKAEVLRTARTVTVLAMIENEVGAFEKVAMKLRTHMGYPARTFETIVPKDPDLPDPYDFESASTEVKAVLDDLKLEGIKPEEVKKAFRAKLKPAGALTLLETTESRVRYSIEEQLQKRGAAEDSDPWIFGVEGPDDPALDLLENLMRAKFGWDPRTPRPLRYTAVRLDADEVPPGWSHTPKEDSTSVHGTLQAQGGVVITYRILHRGKFAGTKPGDVELEKDDVYFHATGPEAAWPVLDQLDALFRKKMRLGPSRLHELLPGVEEATTTKLLDGFAKNTGLEAKDIVAATVVSADPWAGLIELADPARAAAVVEKARGFFPKGSAFVTKGRYAGLISSIGTTEEKVRAGVDVVRTYLRVPKP